MMRSMKGLVVGAVALAGATVASADVQAMPIQPPASQAGTTDVANGIEHVWWRGGWRRGWGWRGGYYGWRRPFVGYYGWRRPFYGYGWRRPFIYGYRRW